VATTVILDAAGRGHIDPLVDNLAELEEAE
jgi:hypothetical protein